MYRAKKPLLFDLNEHLVCKLCKGYFVDATTIIECLHTFCRSCIVKYLETTKYCPICDVQVHKSKPLLSLRSDKIIQDVVYKLVPRLYQNESRRRKEFQKNHPDTKLSASEENFEASHGFFLSPEEELSVTLTYYGSLGKPRYLRCPSAVSVMVLQKLIRAKFDLSDTHHVDILHNQDCLSPCHTLMDIMYIYKLSKLEPLDLTYRIYEYMAKKLKLENQDCKKEEQTDISNQQPVSNNNNWKEVQLRISENGEMSITGIQDDITSQSFSKEMIEVLDSKPKSPITSTSLNSLKKKELPELKAIRKPTQNSKCINIISDTIIRSQSIESRPNDCLISNSGTKGIGSAVSSVPSMNSSTTTVFTTVNSTKCSVGTADGKEGKITAESAVENVEEESLKKNVDEKKDVKQTKEGAKGIKRKFDDSNTSETKIKPNNHVKKIHMEATITDASAEKKLSKEDAKPEKIDEKLTSGSSKGETKNQNCEVSERVKSAESDEKSKFQFEDTPSNNKSDKYLQSVGHTPTSNGSNGSKQTEEEKNLLTNPTPPKPSTKYQGGSQPCYMPKTSFNPVLNIPKLNQSNVTPKNETKTSSKIATNARHEIKSNSSGSPISTPTINSNTVTKQRPSTKVKSNAPMGYKTLKDPPKSWNSQISKANLNKAQPDQKYSDLKNVRPAKFFKMRNNMLRFLGNPASGVKPMYSVHVNADQDKLQEKVVENREIKKHSIVKIDPKTLKPISEKAPETSSLSSQVSTTADLKINTSSVSIFNPLKLQSNSPKSERKSPKSPQSPRHKSSPSPSPPVPKRDKPNLNFTPPNPFVPNLSSQTVSPNQFLCGSGPPGFPSYDPRVMAAYHNLFYGPAMGFPPNPLSYHLGGLDMGQRGKGFDISKIVGMQQQASSSKSPSSSQSTSKLDVPIVPPQVPYQPRPNPMSSRASNMTPASKRSHKDLTKNEKSLQNTVEKLTLSRAKEIHRAAEALSKLNSSDTAKIDNDKNNKVEKKPDKEKDENEATGSQSTGGESVKTHSETKTSPPGEEKKEITKSEVEIVQSKTNETEDPTSNTKKSENSDKTGEKEDSKSQQETSTPDPHETSKQEGDDMLRGASEDSQREKDAIQDNADNVNKTDEGEIKGQQKSANNTDNIAEKSDDSIKTDDSVKEADNKAGSEKIDGLDGNK